MPAKTSTAATTTAKENKPKKATPVKAKQLGALSAAAKVLAEAGHAMNSKEMIEAMTTKGYWASPAGRTPHATLYAAIVRELTTKGAASRFQKTDPGKFAATKAAAQAPDPAPAKTTKPKRAKATTAKAKGPKTAVAEVAPTAGA